MWGDVIMGTEVKKFKVTEKKKWFLCIGDEKRKIPKCHYSNIKIIDRYKPLWASSMRVDVIKNLSIYCNFSHRFIIELKTSCNDFQNRELFSDLDKIL